jgi:hypothetical protein
MALAHFVALLRKLFRNYFDALAEAGELRRDMARRHPRMEE